MKKTDVPLCPHCKSRRVAYHVNFGTLGDTVRLCEECYRVLYPADSKSMERYEKAYQRMLLKGRCRFCGGAATGGVILPGEGISSLGPERYLCCPKCMQYAEEFKSSAEGRLEEQPLPDLHDEAGWERTRAHYRDWFTRCELFIRKRVSENL